MILQGRVGVRERERDRQTDRETEVERFCANERSGTSFSKCTTW
jgi:hypothetical protein